MSTFSNEEKVQILSDIVAMNTVNDNEIEVARYLQQLFNKHGIDSRIQEVEENRANLIAEIGEGSPVLGISGHMDVVPEGKHEQWKYDPFTLTEDDGMLYGRGAADMKSGLAALAIALIEIKENDLLPKGRIKFIATTGEEKAQLGSQKAYEAGEMNDVDALVIAEPCQNMLVIAHKGSMDYRIISKGKAAHSSMPVIGKNAITPLIDFIKDIDKEYEEILKDNRSQSLNLSGMYHKIEPQLPQSIDPEYIKNVLEGLVISNTVISGGTQVNSVPDNAEAEFNIRTIPEYNNARVKQLFNQTLEKHNQNGAQLESDLYLDLESVLTNGKNALVDYAKALANEKFNDEFEAAPTVAITDASNLLRDKDEDFPFIVFGPGENPHQINECVSKDKYLDFTEYYVELFTTYLKNS
ncbi:ArgE/DapE family deacylase [Staphylococcus sp. SQ8-PEA]|uniref:Probable succinyl-diaminopimelate desuccinylase n=1 Tax=Staphylococcus marylandisciuri TaxID=2981529 RepID=A0ABT2QN69_9STAP|nr:ArgE/DapE family deacylase [Staphylococcus marylandisciuri]MCU5745417.1 ArgE/DapE family deacylase [Staphylococcus marylandisciuri]